MASPRVSDVVRAEVCERFSPEEASEVILALETTALPFLDAPDRGRERARVHLATLKVAGGDLPRFRQALALARTDWRDVLVAAGLAHHDWPETLRAAGWRVP
jgi:plasmid stabilization system protein ParE